MRTFLFQFFLLFLLLAAAPLASQTTTVDFCPDIPAGPFTVGETITVPVLASGIIDIVGVQLFLNYPSADLSLVSVEGVEGINTQFATPIVDEARIVYTDATAIGVTHPDGTEFFTLTFELLNELPSLNLSLTTSTAALEATNNAAVILPTSYCGVIVSTGGPNNFTSEFCAQVTQDEVAAGDPFVGNVVIWSGFTDVTSFTYQVQYDPIVMQYDTWTTIVELGDQLTVDEPTPGLLVVSWAGDPLTLISGVGFVTFNFTTLQDTQNPLFSLITTAGSAEIVYAGDIAGNIQFCGGNTFDPNSFVDFCPDNPEGPFAEEDLVEVLIRVDNFADISVVGLPLRYDSSKFELQDILADVPNDGVAISWETVPGGGIRAFLVDFSAIGVDVPDGSSLMRLSFRTLEAADSIDVQIDPSAGDFYASQDLDLTFQQQVTACNAYFLGNVLANVNATVLLDSLNNCSGSTTGERLMNWTVTFTQTVTGLQFSAVISQFGSAYLSLPESDYTYEWYAPGNPSLWENCGVQNLTVDDQTSINDILVATVNVLAECSDVVVNVSSFNLRPCFDNNSFKIDYLNQGTSIAEDAYIDFVHDAAFTPITTTVPYTDLGNNTIRFELGDLNPNEQGSIYVRGLIDCEFPVGNAVCAEATIYPFRTACTPVNPTFGGGEIQVTSSCDGDSVRFSLENVGDGPTGMIEFTIIEDVVIYMGNAIDLGVGETTEFAVPANGTTYRLEAELPEDAPYVSRGLGIQEGCGTLVGGGSSRGFVTAYSLLDGDSWFDRYCQETSAAYDPNDKQAIPAGVGPDNDILPNQSMDYKIRFQNTGTDTAFTVVIRDTIDVSVLNIASIESGVSSHPYRLNINDNVLVFTFENILLPDSTTNEPGSNGFVHFTVDQQADLTDGTVIENTAAIYFDFNDPIITEPSVQTIDRNLLTSKVVNFLSGQAGINVYPSPTSGLLYFDLSKQQQTTQVELMDIFGRQLINQEMAGGSRDRINLSHLPAGRYAYRLFHTGKMIQTGVIAKK
jgi:hypothetical protein